MRQKTDKMEICLDEIFGVEMLCRVLKLRMTIKKKWLSHDNQSPLLTLNLIP